MTRLLPLLILLCCTAGCSSWHYRGTPDHTTLYGRSGSNLSLASGSSRIQFAVPPGWKIISSLDEPLDWNYAADAPSRELSFGVSLDPQSPTLTIPQRQQAYLAKIHQLYDDKIRSARASSFTLADGQSVPAYSYQSSYWGRRVVVIIPIGDSAATFEFSDPAHKFSEPSRAAMQQILGTVTTRSK